jgi:hypothetical protein
MDENKHEAVNISNSMKMATDNSIANDPTNRNDDSAMNTKKKKKFIKGRNDSNQKTRAKLNCKTNFKISNTGWKKRRTDKDSAECKQYYNKHK